MDCIVLEVQSGGMCSITAKLHTPSQSEGKSEWVDGNQALHLLLWIQSDTAQIK